MSEHIDARLSPSLAAFVAHIMERRQGQIVQDAILDGYRDLAAGRVFASSGDFKADMATLDRQEADGWR